MPSDQQSTYTKDELYGGEGARTLTGPSLKEVAFPLGGIGTGNVSLGGRGQLRDWEIFNRPGKGKVLPYTFPAIYTRTASGKTMARVLESKLQPPHAQWMGLPPAEMGGLPRLENAVFRGEYPFANITFEDSKLPVEVELEAFNPCIPLNPKDSGIPAAILRYKVTNNGSEKVDVTICLSMMNACGFDGTFDPGRDHDFFGEQTNEFVDDGTYRGLKMTQSKHEPDDTRFGSMALVTTHKDVTYLQAWTRSGWWDDSQRFWDDFRTDGVFEDNAVRGPSPEKKADIGSLGLKVSLEPGESAELPFIFTWYFPLRENYWNFEAEVAGARLRNRYADFYKDAWDAAGYVAANLARLEQETRKFQKALYTSTLPGVVLDAAGANMSISRTQTCMWLEDDRFYAFEGCCDSTGCCPMNCTHVWNYEQAVAYLFPSMERTMRLTDFTANVQEDGKMAFRTHLPLGKIVWDARGAADGQMGCILKLYREYLLSGDAQYVKQLYPGAKKALDYVWAEWDKDRDGMMEAIQHNTYDIEFVGPNTMMGTLYLGALKAMEKMAKLVGEDDYAEQCREVYEKGSAAYTDLLWNGEYFIQKYDPKDAPKYQFGTGCLSDQLLGQWFCAVVGLGHVLPGDKVSKTLESIFKYNWKSDLSDHESIQRTYALNDEAGLLLCTWPNDGRPALPFVYADEVWTGIEYQVAAHLIYEGMLDEGLTIVKGVRDRHDGVARNPWDEFECGHHYARAMSSWSLLLALSGYHYSAPDGRIDFAPKVNANDFRCFYSTGSGWGTFSQKISGPSLEAEIGADYGSLELRQIGLALPDGNEASSVQVEAAGQSVDASVERDGDNAVVTLAQTARIEADSTLKITVG